MATSPESARISSSVAGLDQLFPRSPKNQEDVETLRPWIFDGTYNAADVQISEWPKDRNRFFDFFRNYSHYRQMLGCLGQIQGRHYRGGVSDSLIETQTITLPRKTSSVPEFRKDSVVYEPQQRALYFLIRETFWGLNITPFYDKLGYTLRINGISPHMMRYHIGGKRFDGVSQGYVAFERDQCRKKVPIISFTGWFENQTWNDFLVENVTIMLGQLASNVNSSGRLNVKDQEVYVVGFYGYHFHIARAFFPAETILRVHAKGCSTDESLELQFTRGYDLFLRGDWLEASEGLARLIRHLLSGSADVRIIQRLFKVQRKAQKVKKDDK